MALRLIEMLVSGEVEPAELFEGHRIVDAWASRSSDDRTVLRTLVNADDVESVLDLLESRFSSRVGFRTTVTNVEATLPRIEEVELAETKPAPAGPAAGGEGEAEEAETASRGRISREEIYEDVSGEAKVSVLYLVTVVLSTIVAAVGLIRDDVAVIVGAMVIAPLLGPNVALALATTLGDTPLAARALKTNTVGLVTAFLLAASLGLLISFNVASDSIRLRTEIGLGDLFLGLAAGAAGALAFTRAIPTAVVGVAVAVALLPPLVAAGLLVGRGEWRLAGGAALLVVANLVCVNLAGVATFLVHGIRPRTWWEADRARRATFLALGFWTFSLVVLVIVIVLSSQR